MNKKKLILLVREILIIPICLIDVNKLYLLKDLKKIKEKSFLWLENVLKFS